MKRKDYQKPTMKVVELQHNRQILLNASRSDYGKANSDVKEKNELNNDGEWVWN